MGKQTSSANRVIYVSIFAGLALWVADGILDHAFFYTIPLLDQLILHVPPHEIYMRLVTVAIILCFGLVVARDIRRQAEMDEALRRSMQTCMDIVESMPAGLFVYGYEPPDRLVLLDCNAEAESFFGARVAELRGRTYQELFPTSNRLGAYIETLRTGKPFIDERARYKDARLERHLRIHAFRMPGDRLGVAFEDITERWRAEAALAEEHERLAVTLRSIGDGVIAADTAGRVAVMNKVAEDLTGWPREEAVGRPMAEVFHIINENTRARAEDPVEKVLATGKVVALANHTLLLARDGAERAIADSGAPISDPAGKVIGVVLVFRDVTEQLRMEREVQKAQKLESIGILAGGIAHDFNNLLTVIVSSIAAARMSSMPGGKIHEAMSGAEKAAFQARDLTKQLLTFSRGGEPVRGVIDLGEVIRESAGFVLRGTNARCEYDIPADLWPADADRGQVSQVLNNVIINAQQAMPGGGSVEVSARNVTIGAGGALPLAPGRYVRISVRDYGVGIPKEHLHSVFDPYFTTKKTGSGLGLSVCYSIVRNHDGHIDLESTVGEGTTVTIHLAAADSQVAALREPAAPGGGVGGRVLLVDDEEAVRSATGRLVGYLGYEVVMAAGGAEAIELYRGAVAAGRPFDVVILDLTIAGGMGGAETMRKLLEIDPLAKGIVSSGYSNDPVMSHFRDYGFKAVVAKPYRLEDLEHALSGIAKS